jgi:hypothetical protein
MRHNDLATDPQVFSIGIKGGDTGRSVGAIVLRPARRSRW